MGSDLLTTTAFAAGVFLAFFWIHLLGPGIVSPLDNKAISRIALVGVFTMLMMVTATHRSRALSTMSDESAGSATALAEDQDHQTAGRRWLE
jgi:hypothetical protein